MEASELKEILEQHKLWIKTNGAEGKHANLTGANLEGANLEGADLTGTILEKNKAEKQPEVGSVKSENLRFEIEAIAKKYGMKVDSIALSFL